MASDSATPTKKENNMSGNWLVCKIAKGLYPASSTIWASHEIERPATVAEVFGEADVHDRVTFKKSCSAPDISRPPSPLSSKSVAIHKALLVGSETESLVVPEALLIGGGLKSSIDDD